MNTIITKKSFLIASALCVMSIAGCKDFVQNVEPPIASVDDALLNSEDQVAFVARGVKVRFDITLENVTLLAEDLSDAFYFDENIPGATFTQYASIDAGDPELDNASVEDAIGQLGQLRLYADTLVSRANAITFKDDANKNLAYFTGYFYGGVARYFWASYFGLNPTMGGGVINKSALIPSNEMYQLAIEKLKLALDYASPEEARMVNTLIARCYLYRGDYDLAGQFAANGMIEGDAPLTGKYSKEVNSMWWADGGVGRTQIVVDPRFHDYVVADPGEAARIPLEILSGEEGDTLAFVQTKYPNQDSPYPFLTWQENELILAESLLRAGDAVAGLTHVNNVRIPYELTPATSLDLDRLILERDKELFASGARLIDQRRFSIWHLGEGSWQFLPITERERNNNPNLH